MTKPSDPKKVAQSNPHLDAAHHADFVARMDAVRAKHPPHMTKRAGVIVRGNSYVCGVCNAAIVKDVKGWTHT